MVVIGRCGPPFDGPQTAPSERHDRSTDRARYPTAQLTGMLNSAGTTSGLAWRSIILSTSFSTATPTGYSSSVRYLHCCVNQADLELGGAAGGVLSPSKRHRDPKVRAVIDHLAASGLWRLHEAKGGRAHPFGTLMCTQGDCRIPVRSTPKGDSQYKILWRKASTCPHGCAPTGPIPS